MRLEVWLTAQQREFLKKLCENTFGDRNTLRLYNQISQNAINFIYNQDKEDLNEIIRIFKDLNRDPRKNLFHEYINYLHPIPEEPEPESVIESEPDSLPTL